MITALAGLSYIPSLRAAILREGPTAVISVRLPDPQFEGQTKAKLVVLRELYQQDCYSGLSEYLEEQTRQRDLKHLRLCKGRLAAL